MNKQLISLNDGSNQKPRLEVHQSWWAMEGLGDGSKEWTIEEKFERIAQAGFTGILGRLPEAKDYKQWRSLLDQYDFTFGVHSFPAKKQDLVDFLVKANDFGVNYVNSQVMDSFVVGTEAIELLQELIEAAAEAKLPYFVETHRGRITQDLIRTVSYVEQLPDLRLTIDFSHYVLAGEMECLQEKAEPYFDALLRRTSSLHGRISNGQQIQINMNSDESHAMQSVIQTWWIKGMAYWSKEAKSGDVLPFVCELGPANYSITLPDSTREITDRWQQALWLKTQVEQMWRTIQGDQVY